MSEDQKYNVVYAGAVDHGFDEEQVKASFVTQLKIPQDKIDQLFSGKRITLKKSLDKQKAEQWQQKLLKIGAETVVVPSVYSQSLATPIATNTDKSSKLTPQPNKIKVPSQPINQNKYDEEMNAKIRIAKAMIDSQKMEQQLQKSKKPNPMKKLVAFTAMLGMLIFFLYFYAESMI